MGVVFLWRDQLDEGELTRHSDDEDDHSLQHLLKDQTVQTPKLSITKEAQ